MKKLVLGIGAATLALSLAACGGSQPENNIAADELNTVSNLKELSASEPAANLPVEETAADSSEPEPAPAKPASAAPKAKAEPTPAKPAPTAAAEPKSADAVCSPEHRAAGHC